MKKRSKRDVVPPDERGKSELEQKYAHKTSTAKDIAMDKPGAHASDELEGQLGPDELSDSAEVVLNREAKQRPPSPRLRRTGR